MRSSTVYAIEAYAYIVFFFNSVAGPDKNPEPVGSGSKATEIDIFLPFFVLESLMNTWKYMLVNFYYINKVWMQFKKNSC
jgi:hypothetical protein